MAQALGLVDVDGEHVDPIGGPPLPLGRRVELRGRGRTFVRELQGPPGARTVVLLHGWLASGGLNWFRAFDSLATRYRVVAPDLRGHARGIRSRRRFRLADCADDVAALIDELDTGPVIAVGYSLGGPVAQLLWKRHGDKVDGLVLCATSHHLMPGVREQAIFTSLMAAAAGSTRMGQLATRFPAKRIRTLVSPTTHERPATMQRWVREEMRRHDVRHMLEAGWAMSNYNARWIDRVDVPTSVVVTTKDRAVPPFAQLSMAMRIPGATVHRIDDGHIACSQPGFGAVLGAAVDDVVARCAPPSIILP